MSRTVPAFSDDQARAHDRIAAILAETGVDLNGEAVEPAGDGAPRVVAVVGKAGSGKTLLLAEVVRALEAAGVDLISGDWEGRRRKDGRTAAVLAPTNKAASVLRARGVSATTIHRILYIPVYDPEFEKVVKWLTGQGPRPDIKTAALTDPILNRAKATYDARKSIPAALAAAGLRGADFISDWTRREDALDIGLIDESSMLDDDTFDDMREIFQTLILFGDPAQLAPVGKSGPSGQSKAMVFEKIEGANRLELSRIHRQDADNPILDLAHALGDPDLGFEEFERMVEAAARRDPRVEVAPRADTDLIARSPVLCWRNKTRIRLIAAFRRAHDAPEDALLPGEPLICDGIELPVKHRKRRLELEERGLIKGAPAIYLGPGKRSGFSRLHVIGADSPRVAAASIVKIERRDEDEPFIPYAARMGAVFLHGAAVTIHKAQGSQWPAVQVLAPDLHDAARSGLTEEGQALWKRLAYVAITRAEERLIWVTRNSLSKPKAALGTDDLVVPASTLTLDAPEGDAP